LLSGNISTVEKVKLLSEIKELVDEGLSQTEIVTKTGFPSDVVKRNIRYLADLGTSELSSKEIAEKRSELFLEFTEAAGEAKRLFDMFKTATECKMCKGKGLITKILGKNKIEKTVPCTNCFATGNVLRTLDANRFLKSWVEIIEKKAKLYGLDAIKTDTIFQLNQQFNENSVSDKVSSTTSEKIKSAIINQHETTLRKKYDKDNEI